jgi:hypothetical protein
MKVSAAGHLAGLERPAALREGRRGMPVSRKRRRASKGSPAKNAKRAEARLRQWYRDHCPPNPKGLPPVEGSR